MKVTGWTEWDDERYSDEIPNELFIEVENAVAKALCDNGYKFDGYYHQYGDYGCPIIDDKWKYAVSMRTWGHMMVLAYPCEIDDSDRMGYCMWAWDSPETPVLPVEDCADVRRNFHGVRRRNENQN